MECKFEKSKPEPKLRHEFIGMMFAVAIGEVGLQVAELVRAGVYNVSACTHIVLATLVIATSWVGWTLSVAPGARKDVEKIFQWEFLVLLLDVVLVILYFILARSVHFEKEETKPAIASAHAIVWTLFWIFLLYFFWDVLTKIIIFGRDVKKEEGKKWHQYILSRSWGKQYGLRMVPTLICLALILVGIRLLRGVDLPSVGFDIAFIALVLFFRALKEVVSAFCPTEKSEQVQSPEEIAHEKERKAKLSKRWSRLAAIACVILMAAGIVSYYCSAGSKEQPTEKSPTSQTPTHSDASSANKGQPK